MIVETGPNASVSCTRVALSGSAQWNSIGGTNAPFSASAPSTVKSSGSPNTRVASAPMSAAFSNTSRRLRQGHQRTHPRRLKPGVADGGLFQLGDDRRDHGVDMRLRHHDPPDGGTFLPGLRGHLAVHFLDEQVKFGRARPRIRP